MMMDQKPICRKCGNFLTFRGWSKRLPAKSEALAECPSCGELWQIRYFHGKATSEPYQVRAKAKKTRHGSWRLPEYRMAEIMSMYGSVQKFLDSAPLVCITLQSKS